MIIPRKYAGSAFLDGQLYAVGGVNREYADLVAVESYNPCAGQWTSVASLNKCKGNYLIFSFLSVNKASREWAGERGGGGGGGLLFVPDLAVSVLSGSG